MADTITELDERRLASISRALSHPARVRIVRLLAAQAECSGSEVFAELPLAQSTVSEHLRVLREAGLVASHPVGTSMVYCLNREPLEGLLGSVAAIIATMPACESEEGER
jgi:ArsR family transcriptional regulator, arsenate/arsenite/antimonite-responsive transcriptional repressor